MSIPWRGCATQRPGSRRRRDPSGSLRGRGLSGLTDACAWIDCTGGRFTCIHLRRGQGVRGWGARGWRAWGWRALSKILPHRDEYRGHLISEGEGIAKEILVTGLEDGEIRVPDVDLAAKAVSTVFGGLALGSIFGDSGGQKEMIVDSVLDMLLNGMIPRKGEP